MTHNQSRHELARALPLHSALDAALLSPSYHAPTLALSGSATDSSPANRTPISVALLCLAVVAPAPPGCALRSTRQRSYYDANSRYPIPALAPSYLPLPAFRSTNPGKKLLLRSPDDFLRSATASAHYPLAIAHNNTMLPAPYRPVRAPIPATVMAHPLLPNCADAVA